MRLSTNPSELQLTAETPHAKVQYWVNVCSIEAEDIAGYCDKGIFDILCQIGCPNYGKKWSCPPCAPSYLDYSRGYRNLCVVLMGIDLDNLSYIRQDFLKIKAANSMLKSRIDKVLRMSIVEGERIISTGSCRLCKPCRKKMDEPCAYPSFRTYSFEALGIDVSAMIKDIFNVDLLWYKKGFFPQYTCVVAGMLSNGSLCDNRIISQLIGLG